MEQLIFKIKTKKEQPKKWHSGVVQNVHEDYLFELVEREIIYEYKPTSKLDKEKLIASLKSYFLKELKAFSVTVE
ncbi:hypothetical protein AAFN75_02580 [Algibacter sp. AS12]|uniref:hypothetical protein n=1 Tax=Algibacter sp. AS12 TaxID=3135773 RepID=UPI00398AE488